MIKACYNELDGPDGLSMRLEAAGHAGYAPAGQDIVCAGASTLMQALVSLLAGEENARCEAREEPEGPHLTVYVNAPVEPGVQGAFALAKEGFALLAERYPDCLHFADVSHLGRQSMMDLQLFAAEGGEAAPALSHAQAQQAVAAGTMKPGEAEEPAEASTGTAAPAGTGRVSAAAAACHGAEHGARPACPLGGRGSTAAPEQAGFQPESRTAQPGNAAPDADARDAGTGCLPAGSL